MRQQSINDIVRGVRQVVQADVRFEGLCGYTPDQSRPNIPTPPRDMSKHKFTVGVDGFDGLNDWTL